jgi:hypothetical protein
MGGPTCGDEDAATRRVGRATKHETWIIRKTRRNGTSWLASWAPKRRRSRPASRNQRPLLKSRAARQSRLRSQNPSRRAGTIWPPTWDSKYHLRPRHRRLLPRRRTRRLLPRSHRARQSAEIAKIGRRVGSDLPAARNRAARDQAVRNRMSPAIARRAGHRANGSNDPVNVATSRDARRARMHRAAVVASRRAANATIPLAGSAKILRLRRGKIGPSTSPTATNGCIKTRCVTTFLSPPHRNQTSNRSRRRAWA